MHTANCPHARAGQVPCEDSARCEWTEEPSLQRPKRRSARVSEPGRRQRRSQTSARECQQQTMSTCESGVHVREMGDAGKRERRKRSGSRERKAAGMGKAGVAPTVRRWGQRDPPHEDAGQSHVRRQSDAGTNKRIEIEEAPWMSQCRRCEQVEESERDVPLQQNAHDSHGRAMCAD